MFNISIVSIKGGGALRDNIPDVPLAEKIAEDFTDFLNTFHSYREPWDSKLDGWLHECYAKVESGRARSLETYNDLKQALAKSKEVV